MWITHSDEMPATKVYEDDDEFPEGVKYSFQYLGPADEAILRYDNAHDAHGVGRHHRHYRGEVEGIDFEGLLSHIETLLEEVEIATPSRDSTESSASV